MWFLGKSDETFVLPIQFTNRIDESESGLQVYAAVMHVINPKSHSVKIQTNKNFILFKQMNPASTPPHPDHVKRAFSTPMAPLDLDKHCFTFDGMYRRGWEIGAFTVRTFYQILTKL